MRAVLEHVVGSEDASRFVVFAGDVVPAKKPDPAIYELALEQLGIGTEDAVVIEDSRNGLLAADAAGIRCVVTLSSYTAEEDMSEAVLVVSSLGAPGEPARVIANRGAARPGELVTLADLDACSHPTDEGGRMTDTALRQAELIVRTVAQTAVDNETYFCELDAVVGDGDFGYSLARGFEIVLSDWDAMEYSDPAGLLKKTAITLTKRIGGTSGPIWGTAFLRAGGSLNDTPAPTGEQVIAALRAAIEGIKQRGKAELGDKTLLDALAPAVDELEATLSEGAGTALERAAAKARASADATKGMVAMRGRASYTGERSRDSVDAGAVGVAVMFEAVSKAWRESELETA